MRMAIIPMAAALLIGGGAAKAQVYDSTLGLGGATDDVGCIFGAQVGSRFPTNVYDPRTGERIMSNISGCTGGYIRGVNVTTGARWNADFFNNGEARGRDLDGDRWRYDPKARLFTNISTRASCAHTDIRHVCKAQG